MFSRSTSSARHVLDDTHPLIAAAIAASIAAQVRPSAITLWGIRGSWAAGGPSVTWVSRNALAADFVHRAGLPRGEKRIRRELESHDRCRLARGGRTFENGNDMKIFESVFSIALIAALAGCGSTSGAGREPATGAAAAPHRHSAGMIAEMADTCPMQISGTAVAASDMEGGVGLDFTTTGDVVELRRRVGRMAEMHDGHGHMRMGGGTPPCAEAEHRHGADEDDDEDGDEDGAGHHGSGHDGMGGRMMMPEATATVEDIEGGARFVLRPTDPAQLVTLREHVHMRAERMADGECPMMSGGGACHPSDSHHAEGGHHG